MLNISPTHTPIHPYTHTPIHPAHENDDCIYTPDLNACMQTIELGKGNTDI